MPGGLLLSIAHPVSPLSLCISKVECKTDAISFLAVYCISVLQGRSNPLPLYSRIIPTSPFPRSRQGGEMHGGVTYQDQCGAHLSHSFMLRGPWARVGDSPVASHLANNTVPFIATPNRPLAESEGSNDSGHGWWSPIAPVMIIRQPSPCHDDL
jgi:hypothetical protein